MPGFGQAVRLAREEKRLSINDLSRVSGIRESDILLIEYGRIEPTLTQAKKLAASVEVNMDS
jgi:ribosome-binding protein aMBF1 (putative translation factor)